ncbi:MAG: phosphorylase, partial [Halodesulfurarchaeum sp.]
MFYNDDGVAATLTGMGHSFCGPSVAAILGSPALNFEDSYLLSAGISGTPPDVGTLGSVFVSDYVVNWDYGHRWAQEDDPRDLSGGSGSDQAFAFQIYPGRPFDYVYELNPSLVEKAVSLSEGVDLADSKRAQEYRQLYPQETAQREPFIDVGTTVSGEEYWHGSTFSDQAQYIADEYGGEVHGLFVAETESTPLSPALS